MYRVEPAESEQTQARSVEGAEPRGEQAVRLYVIRLRHARADDVAATINALYGRASALGELGDRRRPTLNAELREQRVPPVERRRESEAASADPGRPAALAGDVTIVPDPRTNSLLVRAAPADFELIQAAVHELDLRPLQVLIEVVIAEVRRDRRFAFGLDVELPPQRLEGDGTISGSVTGVGLGDFVLEVMRLGGVDLEAALRVAASRGDVEILSRPVILAANNETAEILVGSQRPFVQVARVLPTDAPVRDQVIQFKDVGTRLTVRPTISADGYVRLQVIQEVNAVTNEVAFDAPVISTRTVDTHLLIQDGHTAVLGGLSDRQVDITRGGVPLLSSIPLIGGLFGRTSRQTTETELFLFLTPRVLYDDGDMSEAARAARDSSRYLKNRLEDLPLPSDTTGSAAGDSLPSAADTIRVPQEARP